MPNVVCPDCYRPIDPPKRGHDARCADCLRLLPVNSRQGNRKQRRHPVEPE